MNGRAEARRRLEQERERLSRMQRSFRQGQDELGSTLQTSPADELSSVDQHPADVGTEVFERAKSVSIEQDLTAQLVDVERALQRLEDGTYGVCEACGREIGEARLEARPATRFCLEDQAKAEREVGAA